MWNQTFDMGRIDTVYVSSIGLQPAYHAQIDRAPSASFVAGRFLLDELLYIFVEGVEESPPQLVFKTWARIRNKAVEINIFSPVISFGVKNLWATR